MSVRKIVPVVALILLVVAAVYVGSGIHRDPPPPDRPRESDVVPLPTPIPPPEVQVSTFSGTVVDEPGKPVGGAVVILVRRRRGEVEAIEAKTVADAEGSFRIEGGPGLLLRATAEGYPRTEAWAGTFASSADHRLVLRTGGRLLVRVLAEESGEPLADARINVNEMPPAGAKYRPWNRVEPPNGKGRFEFTPPLGRVYVHAACEGRIGARTEAEVTAGEVAKVDLHLRRTATLPIRVIEEGTRDPIEGVVVSGSHKEIGRTDAAGRLVLEGLREQVGFVLTSPWHIGKWEHVKNLSPGRNEEREIALIPAGQIPGRILDAEGQPVEGAWVATSWWSAWRGHYDDENRSGGALLSDADGRFTLTGVLPAARVQVFAALEGYGSGAAEPVAVEAGAATEEVTIRLRRTFTVRFLLKTRGDEEVPAVGAWIHNDGDDAFAPVDGVRTGQSTDIRAKDGVLEVAGLFPGKYRIRLNASGWVSREYKGTEVAPEGGVGVREIEVVMERGESISGRVLDAARAPLAGGTVVATYESPPGAYRYYTNSAEVDETGQFTVSGLIPGKYTLLVRNRNRTDVLERKGVASGTRDLVLRPPAGGAVTGRVVGPDGTAPRHVTVLAFRDDGERPPGKGKGGVVWGSAIGGKLEMELLPGTWWLIAFDRYEWGAPAATRVVVGTGETPSPEIRMVERTTISGRITSDDGPVADALVVAHPFPVSDATPYHFRGDVGTYRHGRTDEAGNYRIEGTGFGEWTVRAYHPGYLTARSKVTLAREHEEAHADIRLPSGGFAEVEIVGPGTGPFRCVAYSAAGNPQLSPDDRFQSEVGRLHARLHPHDPGPIRSGDRLRVGPFPPGVHTVYARAEFEGDGKEVTLHRNGTVTIEGTETVPLRLEFTREALETARNR